MSRFFKIKPDFVLHISQRKMLLLIVMISSFLISFGALFFRGVNYGIDFKGGLSIEAQISENMNCKWKRNSVGARARESSCVYFFAKF